MKKKVSPQSICLYICIIRNYRNMIHIEKEKVRRKNMNKNKTQKKDYSAYVNISLPMTFNKWNTGYKILTFLA